MTTLDQAIELGLNADEYNETIKYYRKRYKYYIQYIK